MLDFRIVIGYFVNHNNLGRCKNYYIVCKTGDNDEKEKTVGSDTVGSCCSDRLGIFLPNTENGYNN